jgi:hypothetical protein
MEIGSADAGELDGHPDVTGAQRRHGHRPERDILG